MNMPTPRESKREARLLLITWLLLVGLTLGSFWLADSSMLPARAAAWVLGLAALKGLLIAGVFMEMRRGPGVAWAAMSAFLLAEPAFDRGAYEMSSGIGGDDRPPSTLAARAQNEAVIRALGAAAAEVSRLLGDGRFVVDREPSGG